MHSRLDISWNERGEPTLAAAEIKIIPLLNSMLGPKPVVLVGTKSKDGVDNLAIFNTLSQLGTNPPLYSLLIRPLDRVRDTYANIIDGKYWTCNAIPPQMMNQAHATAEHFPPDRSEFEVLGIEKESKVGVEAPFVFASPVQMWIQYIRKLPIPENGTQLLIGRLRKLWVDERWMNEGSMAWHSYQALSSWGVNGYSLANDIRCPHRDVDCS